jgi:hypothetical protein
MKYILFNEHCIEQVLSIPKEEFRMSLSMWMVLMFLLGIGAMALCGLFLKACEKI